MTDRSVAVFHVSVQPEGKGEAERLDLTGKVLSFEYEDNEKKTDLLKLTVDNRDLSNFDDPVWKQGNKLIVSWGYPGAMAPARECIIQKVTGALMLSIEAQGKAVLMNKAEKAATYEKMTRSQVVRQIANANGFANDKCDIEETPIVHDVISQARATDAQFIKRLADLEGFEFYVDFDGLHWHSRRMGQKPLRVLQYYLPPDVGDIITFNVENDIFAKPGKVTTKGRDPLEKKDVTASGSDSETPRDTTAPLPEIIDPVTGQSSFGSNAASETTMPTTETNQEQAKREADGKFKRAQQTTVKLTLSLVGDALICAKSVLDVRGISKRLSGLYYVNQANHKVDSNGTFNLSLKCSSDGTHGHSQDLLKSDVPTKKKPESKANPNPNKGETPDAGQLEQVEVIDPITGQPSTSYRETGGRPVGDTK